MNTKPQFDVNQDVPDDFSQDAYNEYKEDNRPDDFTQYEVSPVAERIKPSVKKRK